MRYLALAALLLCFAATLPAQSNEKFVAMTPESGDDLRIEQFAGRSLAVFAFCRS
jgi:hypothetical protein